MALNFGPTDGTPVAFGKGATADDRNLFLKVFGGEVLTAFSAATVTAGKTREKTIGAGKSWQFPRTGASEAGYITRGKELMGSDFATDEVTVTVDAPLVSIHELWDLDELMAHFDIRSPMTSSMGEALARTHDRNVLRSVALAARSPALGGIPFSGGSNVTAADLLTSGAIDGMAWLARIRQARLLLRAKNIPDGITLYLAVKPAVFDAIKYAKENGVYVNLNSTISMATAGVGSAVTEFIRFEGVLIFSSNLMPDANETAVADVYAKYRADYSKTAGLLWSPDAVATLSLLNVTTETGRDFRRQQDVMIAKRVNGHGTLRNELAVEFRLP